MTVPQTHAQSLPGPGRGWATRVLPLRSAVGLLLATPVLTWWAIGPLGRQWPDHAFGPYHLPVGPERAVGVGAVMVAVAALVHSIRAWRGRQSQGGLKLRTTAYLLILGVTAASGWRTSTAGGVGANIGAGAVLLLGPVLVAVLVVSAVNVECAARHVRPRRRTLLAGLAVLTAPTLWAGAIALTAYDQARGVITARQLASVHVGDARDRVRDRLGPRSELFDGFFAAPPAGSTCDYWSRRPPSQPLLAYRVCYAARRVVVTQASDHPYNPG